MRLTCVLILFSASPARGERENKHRHSVAAGHRDLFAVAVDDLFTRYRPRPTPSLSRLRERSDLWEAVENVRKIVLGNRLADVFCGNIGL